LPVASFAFLIARLSKRIAALPKAQQRFVMQMLDTVLQQSG
jgi:hypothetical protein